MISNIRKIYLRDLRAIFHHKAAFITILALCILPSLYTLVNVGAIWNPYSTKKTEQIPVAVVSEDKGASLDSKQLNFGDQVIKSMKDNKQIGWRFVDRKTADTKLRSGKYYGEIILPADFSKKLTSIASSNPERANVIFKTNTKNSPMGVKITETAAESLTTEIKNKFIYQISETIFSYLNNAGTKLNSKKSEILQLKDMIVALGDGMDLATDSLNTIQDTANGMATALTSLNAVNQAAESNNSLQAIADGGTSSLRNARSSLNSASEVVNDNLKQLNTRQQRVGELVDQISSASTQQGKARLSETARNLKTEVSVLKGQTKALSAFLGAFDSKNQSVNNMKKQLSSLDGKLSSQEANIRSLQNSLNGSNQNLQAAVARLTASNRQISNRISSSLISNNQQAKAAIDQMIASSIDSSNKASAILGSVGRIKQLNSEATNNAISSNKLIADSAGKLSSRLNESRKQIETISNKLKLTDNSDIAEIINVLQSNPTLIAGDLTTLFNVKSESIYRVATFGEAFAPSYMALSIWVGCTMLIAVLRTTVPDRRRFRHVSRHEEYFGKMLIFSTISLVQTAIIITSTILVLHVHIANLFVILMTGLFVSLAFSTLIYTAASVFGNLGTAMMVMLVALQLAGSGAMYPVQLNPLVFRILQPLFPFTYGVGAFREAIGGVNIESIGVDFFILGLMFFIAIFIGVVLKVRIKRVSDKLKRALEDTGIGG
ncbi:YhgE/Pip domain-containing protein [Lentilactobacillus sp. Marseille-Q4993]|uniref:YhgE/Pip domain-containing protein n=1 Tax=Lentilactobacillus sp. Marseille-Q4993 TaxID=3039492 RepID=UPI0024BBFA15|nr:YhgE/Pip domain-containing protein [Lentilactobacillus sp. Marseille-Q4993]